MKKAKRNAVLYLLIFALLAAGGVYMAVAGVGKNHTGKVKDIPLGLDLQGGLSVTYEITNEDPTDAEIDATIDKLQRRVDEYSSEGEVYQQGDNRIVVEIPVDTEKNDAHDILDQLGKPGQLLFIDEENYQLFASGQAFYALLDGSDVKKADPGTDDSSTGKEYVVGLTFTDAGAEKFEKATAANIGKRIYIIYDGAVASAPVVNSTISGGMAQIDGMEDLDEAKELASTINIGALPLELKQLQYNVVGAKLGSEAVNTSINAGIIGFAVICVLMIVIYLFPGFVAVLALSAYVLLMALILSVRSVTLTLPGIAGILLSIGMAVDANVIIFTRIKEEIATGKNARNAVDTGFHKALSAILDGNITTLIAAFVLMAFGSGTIKGFATTLMIGIILSMFTAIVITKGLLNAFLNLGVTKTKFYGKAGKPRVFNYVKNARVLMVISALIIIAGIAFLPINKSKDGEILNFGLEFTGGTSTTVEFDKAYTLEEVEKNIVPKITEAMGMSASEIQIQVVENSNEVIFKTPEISGEKEDENSTVETEAEKFAKVFAEFNGEVVSENTISSTISGEMRKDAIIAIAVSAVLMLIYVAFRFSDVKFGISAVIALLHDVMVVFAIYSIGKLAVGGTFIACMLTILGYSINATIVIFDRIRENLQENKSGDDLANIVNTSIAQTFTRSIYTSLTTFIMVLALFVFGVASLKEFTYTLMAGVVCGAYSSICITGPLWYYMKRTKKTKNKEA